MQKVTHKRTSKGPVEIRTDGKTTWVNSASGAMIGRLSPMGLDVHGTGEVHCLDCRPPPSSGVWQAFVESMLKHHDVLIPLSFRPRWCK